MIGIPYENVNDPNVINERFYMLETLNMVTFLGDSRTVVCPDFANYHAVWIHYEVASLEILSSLPHEPTGRTHGCHTHSKKIVISGFFGPTSYIRCPRVCQDTGYRATSWKNSKCCDALKFIQVCDSLSCGAYEFMGTFPFGAPSAIIVIAEPIFVRTVCKGSLQKYGVSHRSIHCLFTHKQVGSDYKTPIGCNFTYKIVYGMACYLTIELSTKATGLKASNFDPVFGVIHGKLKTFLGQTNIPLEWPFHLSLEFFRTALLRFSMTRAKFKGDYGHRVKHYFGIRTNLVVPDLLNLPQGSIISVMGKASRYPKTSASWEVDINQKTNTSTNMSKTENGNGIDCWQNLRHSHKNGQSPVSILGRLLLLQSLTHLMGREGEIPNSIIL
ncbi:hypothetical protein Tco_0099182 [Tanacetum coccineum]